MVKPKNDAVYVCLVLCHHILAAVHLIKTFRTELLSTGTTGNEIDFLLVNCKLLLCPLTEKHCDNCFLHRVKEYFVQGNLRLQVQTIVAIRRLHAVLAFRHKGVRRSSSIVFQGLTSFLFLPFISLPNLSADRAGHFEIPLRLVGHPVPAAQTGGGRAVSAAARRPFLPRICRLHLPVVSAHFAMFELRLKGLWAFSVILQWNSLVWIII